MSRARPARTSALRARVGRPAGAVLRRTAVRVPALARLPGVGPPTRRILLAEAQRRLRTKQGLAPAERWTCQLAGTGTADTRTLSLLTRLRAALGDAPGTDAAGSRLAARPDADVDALLAWHSMRLRGHGESADATQALDRAVRAVPRSAGETRALLSSLRRAGRPEDLPAVVARARAAGVEVDPRSDRMARVVALELAEGRGPAALDAEVDRQVWSGPAGTAVAGRFLIRRGELFRAADVYRDLPPEQVPSGLLFEGVRDGRAAGHVRAPYALCAVLAAAHGGNRRVARLWTRMQDEHRLLEQGFPEEPPGERRVEPAERRVLYVLHTSVPYGHAGYAVRSHGIATGLLAHGWGVEGVSRLDFPVDQVWWPDEAPVPPCDVVDGLTYHRLLSGDPSPRRPPRLRYARQFGDALETLARARRPSLLHAASFAVNGQAAHVTARRLGIPWVYEVRGLQDLAYVSLLPERRDTEHHDLLRRVELQTAGRADRVLVITGAIRDEFAGQGIPEERMVVVPNGVHAADHPPRPRDEALAALLGLSDKTVVGYVGSIAFYEGVEYLLEAVARMRARRPDLAALVVGYGDAEPSVRATVERLSLHDVVRLPGRVPPEDASRYLSLLDVFAAPRRGLPVTELVSPLKLFQPMSMEIPTVVSDCAALTEIVEDGVTGLVHRKDDVDSLVAVLDRLLDSPDLGRRLGATASQWVRRERDWSVITARVADVYADVVDRWSHG